MVFRIGAKELDVSRSHRNLDFCSLGTNKKHYSSQEHVSFKK